MKSKLSIFDTPISCSPKTLVGLAFSHNSTGTLDLSSGAGVQSVALLPFSSLILKVTSIVPQVGAIPKKPESVLFDSVLQIKVLLFLIPSPYKLALLTPAFMAVPSDFCVFTPKYKPLGNGVVVDTV